MKRVRVLPPALGVAVVLLGTLVVPFDTAVNVAFPAIIDAFALPIPAIQWVVIAYTLTYAALMLVFGRLGDMLGHRRVFLLGSACSAAAFLGCAAAPSYAWLLVARVAQGVGAALALSCGPALVTGLYPESQRARILGLYTMVFGAGSAAGAILAGVLVARFGWPAVFWFRAPLSLTAFLLAWGLPVAAPSGPRESFDGAGAALLVLATAALLFGLNRLPMGLAVPFFALSGLAGLGFVLRERRTAFPIIDLRCFREAYFAWLNLGNVAVSLTGFSVPLLAPFFLVRVAGLSAPQEGLMLAVGSLGTALAAPIAGRLASHVPPRRLVLAGAAATAVGQALMSMTGPSPDLLVFGVWMFVQGVGLGLFQVGYFDIATATLPREQRGVAGSLVMMTRTLGIVAGATVLMLGFQTLRARAVAAGAGDDAAFLVGFQEVYRLAALLPVGVIVVLNLARVGGRGGDA
ncbi:MAG TPA: MFS transporter [Acetobacteraceae bacterium]|jgi:MFS family permease|nr:MFS transporter [Acetobacteraceae bacterium]